MLSLPPSHSHWPAAPPSLRRARQAIQALRWNARTGTVLLRRCTKVAAGAIQRRHEAGPPPRVGTSASYPSRSTIWFDSTSQVCASPVLWTYGCRPAAFCLGAPSPPAPLPGRPSRNAAVIQGYVAKAASIGSEPCFENDTDADDFGTSECGVLEILWRLISASADPWNAQRSETGGDAFCLGAAPPPSDRRREPAKLRAQDRALNEQTTANCNRNCCLH